MKLVKYIILFICCSTCVTLYSQNGTITNDNQKLNCIQNDSMTSRFMAESYYQATKTLDRDFDYEMLNKKRRLQKLSKEVMTLGWITTLVIGGVNGWLAYENDWSYWIDIPCATVVMMAAIYSFDVWSKNLKKKAEQIDVATIVNIPFDDDSSIGIARFSRQAHPCDLSLGFTFKKSF